MATKKISELEEINQAENDDYLVVVDTSESKNKKITKGNFLKISDLEEKISDLENNQLTASTEGTSIDINDSADYQVREMIPNGNVIQNSTTGKNKFAGADTTVNNGITFKKNSDGSYNITGSATAQANAYNYVDINNSGLVNGQTYTFWASQVLPAEFFVLIEAYNGTTWQRHAMNGLKDVNQSESQVINLTDTTRIRFALRVNEGTTINISNLKIQLESGSTATNFEKYTGGIASPNPQYEQPINSAGDGINLLPNEATNQTINGLTFVVNEDKSITINGTATANTDYTLIGQSGVATEVLKLNANQNYYNTTSLRLVYRLVDGNYGAINSGAFTSSNDLSIRHIYLSINNGTVMNNVIVYPQIVKGTKPKDYEEYGKHYINEIISNKNSLPVINGSYTSYELTTNWEGNTATINGTCAQTYSNFMGSSLIPIYLTADEYTISASDYTYNYTFRFQLKDGTIENTNIVGRSSTIEFTQDVVAYRCWIYRSDLSSVTFSNYKVSFQIEKGSSATSFVAHQEQNISIPCQQPMRSIGNVRDGFVKIDGVWYEKHNIGQIVLNGTESGWLYDSDNFYFRTSNYTFEHTPKTNTNDTVQLSNYFKHTSGWGTFRTSHTTNLFYSVQNSGYKICFRNVDITTVSDWTNWLQNHNVEVIYPTEEPYYLECTEEQITALEQARTYKPVTHISSADVVPAYLGVTYVRDLETVINNLS